MDWEVIENIEWHPQTKVANRPQKLLSDREHDAGESETL